MRCGKKKTYRVFWTPYRFDLGFTEHLSTYDSTTGNRKKHLGKRVPIKKNNGKGDSPLCDPAPRHGWF